MAKKRLPKWATTVTPFSKFLALSMLIIFPIIGFYLGKYYQKTYDQTVNVTKPITNTPEHSKQQVLPNILVVTRLENKTFNLAPFTTTITDTNVVQQLYKGLDAFKVLPPNTTLHCPMIPAGYQPVNYDLSFYKEATILRQVVFTPPGCRDTIKLEDNEVAVGITVESVTFEQTLKHALNLSTTQFRGYGRD